MFIAGLTRMENWLLTTRLMGARSLRRSYVTSFMLGAEAMPLPTSSSV